MVSSNYAIKCLVKNRNKLRAGFFSCQLFRFLTVINDSGIACIYTASHNAPIRYFDKNLFFSSFSFSFLPAVFHSFTVMAKNIVILAPLNLNNPQCKTVEIKTYFEMHICMSLWSA